MMCSEIKGEKVLLVWYMYEPWQSKPSNTQVIIDIAEVGTIAIVRFASLITTLV